LNIQDDSLKNFSWSEFHLSREQVINTYSSAYKLKIKKKILEVILEELKSDSKILDIGSHDRSLGDKITAKASSITYKSMDINRALPHDYYAIEEIKGTFDMVILSEVIEHLEFNQGISLLRKLFNLLNNNGKIIISTPNLYHPNRYWDSDHKTPYRYDEIGAVLNLLGLKLCHIYRIYNDSFFKRLFRIYLMAPIHSYFDIDFAKSIVVIAVKI
jgi:SAM-dependent methyltransferase